MTALHALNGRWPGVTVNVGAISGGTRPNVVPAEARLEVDLRAVTACARSGGGGGPRDRARATVVRCDITIEVE